MIEGLSTRVSCGDCSTSSRRSTASASGGVEQMLSGSLTVAPWVSSSSIASSAITPRSMRTEIARNGPCSAVKVLHSKGSGTDITRYWRSS